MANFDQRKLRQCHYNTLSKDLETAVEDLYRQLSSVRMLSQLLAAMNLNLVSQIGYNTFQT